MKLLTKLRNTYLNTNYGKYVLFAVLIFIVFIFMLSKIITDREVADTLKVQHATCAENVQNKIKIHIENKKEINSFVALSLANDTRIIEALKKNDNTQLNLQLFASKLEKLSLDKTVWFQIIDKNGKSFYRSWTNKSGDDMIKVRADIVKMIEKPHIMSTISTGKYAMTFKSMVPIYDNNNFIGIFEVITHFDSLYKKLKKENLESIFIVDKSYKKQIMQPFYPLFIGDYYISMDNPNPNILQILQFNGVEKYINANGFLIDKVNNYGVVIYNLPDIDGKQMGYIIAFKKTTDLPMHEIHYVKQHIMAIFIILILFIILLGYYFLNKQHEDFISKQHKKHEKEIERNTKFLTIGQMAAGITHEINTPLTYIKGTNEMSKFDIEDMPNSNLKTTLLLDNKKIADGIKRISNIVESMREMAQVSSAIKENSNLYATLITTLRLINNRSKHISKIYLNGELFENETANKEKYKFIACINKQKIEQVWTIIINNALDELVKIEDYEQRILFITINADQDDINITFQDNAGGINEEIIESIFEPFVSSKLSHGIGIGLNVAKKILDEHEAIIEVANKDKGALFIVKFKKSETI